MLIHKIQNPEDQTVESSNLRAKTAQKSKARAKMSLDRGQKLLGEKHMQRHGEPGWFDSSSPSKQEQW